MISGTEPARQATQGVPHDIASIMHQSEGFRPIDGKQQRARLAEEFALVALPDFSYEFHVRLRQQRLDLGFEVLAVGARPPWPRSGASCRRGARSRWRGRRASPARCAQEREIAIARLRAEAADTARQAVMHGARPVGMRQWAVADRWRSTPPGVRGAAQNISGYPGRSSRPCSVVSALRSQLAQQREMQVVGVEMDHVELGRARAHRLELQQGEDMRVLDVRCESQRRIDDRMTAPRRS